MPASGSHSHKGHRGKRQKPVAPHLLRDSASFLLSEMRPIDMRQMKFEWSQSMDCVKNGVILFAPNSQISL